MKATHTPEPWHDTGRGIFDKEDRCLARIQFSGHTISARLTNEERDANARLIAAAPALLAALRGLVRVTDRATMEFDAARAAIAKAEGQP